MYSVVEVSGHQYKVAAGDLIDVEKLNVEAGSTIDLDQVLFVGGENPAVGAPTVAGAKVQAKVIKHDRSRKVIVFKRRPGQWRKKNGHRQHYTSLLITAIADGKGGESKIDESSDRAKKYLK